jgi:hypothetical protein
VGRVADRLTFVSEAVPTCGVRVQVGTSLFVCRGPKGHPVEPDHEHQGYGGRGHTLVSAQALDVR